MAENHQESKIKRIFKKIWRRIKSYFSNEDNYIHMRLFVEDITSEFEEGLREKVHHTCTSCEIREAEEEDLESIIRLHDKAWHTTPMPYQQVKKKKLRKLFEDEDFVFLIAKMGSIDVGFAIIYFGGNKKDIGVIAGLGVEPKLQKKGLGTMIGMAIWDYFKKRGIKELRCKVYKGNETAYSFISELGFKEFKEVKDYTYLKKF
ncbi:MAG: GNAT family N-acetyltransferase [Candidatus Lokiarchaeota archaeon]|nr:GNAT family N-acetyltransferase [Candidatus Lokiarchaeota archaeon]MBD3340742.1 GNAT family N-acetyltransferase [Candidatus Lokiarchaeota archaeon]